MRVNERLEIFTVNLQNVLAVLRRHQPSRGQDPLQRLPSCRLRDQGDPLARRCQDQRGVQAQGLDVGAGHGHELGCVVCERQLAPRFLARLAKGQDFMVARTAKQLGLTPPHQ